MRRTRGYREREEKEETGAKGRRKPSQGVAMMALMVGMMTFCLAAPFLLGSLVLYLSRIGWDLPLESGYLGPAVFLLAHLAMIPIFLHKSKD